MAMRVMLQNGLKGLSHHPANDTLYPAGYECPWANYFYTQENAITFAGGENGRAAYIRRTGRLIDGMGPLLASTHLAADAGIIYPMATYPQTELTPEEIQRVADVAGRLLWSGAFDHYNFELVDSDHTPLENFERYRVLLLPNPQAGKDAAEVPASWPVLRKGSTNDCGLRDCRRDAYCPAIQAGRADSSRIPQSSGIRSNSFRAPAPCTSQTTRMPRSSEECMP